MCLTLYIVASRVEGGPQSIPECALTRTPIISTDVGIASNILSSESIFSMDNFIKAKLVVKVGDSVQQGQALFFDKKSPQVYFHSPISGIIKHIEYGPQRRLDLIQIEKTDSPEMEFSPISIESATATDVKSALLERGLWHGLIELPFYNVPDPSKTPPAIIIPLSHSEPFQPKLSTVINEYEADIIAGIQWLKKMCPEVKVFVDANEKIMDRKRENMKKLDMVRQAKKQGKSLKLLDLKPSNQAQQKRPGFEGRRDSPLNSAKKIKSRGGSSK